MYQILDNLATCSLLEGLTPEGWIIVDVRDLLDDSGNDIETLKIRIMVIGNLMGCGQKVVVRCLAGMSRSNTLACAAMMMFNFKTWDENWEILKTKVTRAHQNLELLDDIKKALLELGVHRKRLYYE